MRILAPESRAIYANTAIYGKTRSKIHERIFWWVLIPLQIFSPVAERKENVCIPFHSKGLILLNNISWFIYLPVQWGSSPVFLSVEDICQFAAGHTPEYSHFILISFPPNQHALSQSRIQSAHNPRFPRNRVEACDSHWSIRCGIKNDTGNKQRAMGRDHCPPRNLCLTRHMCHHDWQGQSFWYPVLNVS